MLNALGLIAQDRGQLTEAAEFLNQAAAVADSAHNSGYAAKARGNLGLVYKDFGEYDKARAAFMTMRDAATAMRDETVLGNALNNLGMLETLVGDPDRAIGWLTDARVHYRAIDDADGVSEQHAPLHG